MNITFYNDKQNRTWSFDNVTEVITRSKWVEVKCVEPNGNVFRTREMWSNFNRMEIERD